MSWSTCHYHLSRRGAFRVRAKDRVPHYELFGRTLKLADVMLSGHNYGHWKGVKILKNLE